MASLKLDVYKAEKDRHNFYQADYGQKEKYIDWGEAKKSTLMVKFDRSDVEDLIGMPNESEELIVTGKTIDGTSFTGNDTIRAIKLSS